MAISILNNLYPPLVDTYMPAFIRDGPCQVYFSLSDFNSEGDIINVQVIVSNQTSSLSALDSTQYPSNIMIKDLLIDNSILTDAKYYVEISPSDLRDGAFEVGQYYKVQLRFTGLGADRDVPKDGGIAQWLQENEGFFSEWSSVCLIRGIERPIITLRGFTADEGGQTIFSSAVVNIAGQMSYATDNLIEDEYLEFYVINIYTSEGLVYTSGKVYTNEFYPNEINYTLKYELDAGVDYILQLQYQTHNLYDGEENFSFMIISNQGVMLDAWLTATPDPDNGRIIINVTSKDTSPYLGNLAIRRASSKDDYKLWEDVNIVVLTDPVPLDYTWYDYTAQSGVYYDYAVMTIDTDGVRGPSVKLRHPTMLYLQDMFLTREDMQVCVRFDPQISSYKVTLSESKIDTLGSRYPYFNRNGNIAYKQFPISGLIMSYSDYDHVFTSPEIFYGDNAEYYARFNEDEQIPEYRDFIYERNFRETVMKFLYDDNVKLFKSLTEGNILVRLMDISFTPNETLGRMLYNFSATAYEVDEATIDNYQKYGILTVGEYSTFNVEYEDTKVGQYHDVAEAGQNIITDIIQKYEDAALEGYVNIVEHINWIQIQFQSDPYLIDTTTMTMLQSYSSYGPGPTISDPSEHNDNVVYGYIVYINGETIVVSPRGYYALDSDIDVWSIEFPCDTDVIVDYTVTYGGTKDTNVGNVLEVSEMYYYKKVGQEYRREFDMRDLVTQFLYQKYYEDYDSYYQKLISIDEVTIEAEPNTIIYVKDSFDDDYYRHLIGPTLRLHLYDDETIIQGLYFYGIHFDPMSDETRITPERNQYRDSGITVATVDEIESPQDHTVYTITEGIDGVNTQSMFGEVDNQYIYLHDEWFGFTTDGDALCPVEAIVDYVYELEKGVY